MTRRTGNPLGGVGEGGTFMTDKTGTTPTEGADEMVVVAAAVADEQGVLAEGAVAIEGDHALVVARFADTTSARAIYDGLLSAELDGSLHIDGVLVVKADESGRLHVEKMTDHSTRTGLKWGIVGGVVAAVFLPATLVAGAVTLGVAGAAAGKARNLARRLSVEKELADVITPGTSGILALSPQPTLRPWPPRCPTPRRSRRSPSTTRPRAPSRKPQRRPTPSRPRGSERGAGARQIEAKRARTLAVRARLVCTHSNCRTRST